MRKMIVLLIMLAMVISLSACGEAGSAGQTASSAEKLVEEYEKIVTENYMYSYENYYKTLNYYVRENPGSYAMYGEYDSEDLAKMEYMVEAAKAGKTEEEIRTDLKNYIAENKGFLFWVDGTKIIDGRVIDTQVWFKYNASTKTVSAEGGYYEPEWTGGNYEIYVQYELSEVPEWALEVEGFEESYIDYLESNEWIY